MINTWKNFINLKYCLTDPCDPKNQQIMQGSKKDVKDSKNYEELEKIIVDNLIKGKYRCRDDILKSLKDSDIEVTRIGKDYVSVKLPGAKNQNVLKEKFFMKNLEVLKIWESSQAKLEKEQERIRMQEIICLLIKYSKRLAYLERLVDKMEVKVFGTNLESKFQEKT